MASFIQLEDQSEGKLFVNPDNVAYVTEDGDESTKLYMTDGSVVYSKNSFRTVKGRIIKANESQRNTNTNGEDS